MLLWWCGSVVKGNNFFWYFWDDIIFEFVGVNKRNIKKGYSFLLYCYIVMIVCIIIKIIEWMDDWMGLIVEDFLIFLLIGNVGLVEMILLKLICIEIFFDYLLLGRIILCDLK